jgi:DnaJ-class molecular chaperone
MANDFYKTLGINRDASADEIQKAYRKLARKYHPDLHEDEKEKESAKQKFQQIQAAYDVLSEPEKREMYDRFGENYQSMPGGNPAGAGGHGQFGGMDIDFSQLFGGGPGGGGFENVFRQFGGQASPQSRRGRASPQPTPNLELNEQIAVPFSVAISGGEHRLVLDRGGSKPETIDLKIPRGLENGKKIRLRQQGRVGPGGQKGDLIITVNVAPHPYYQRQGNNLQIKLPVTIREAIEGTKVDLPTPHGTITLTVPANCNGGRVLRLKGMGVQLDGGIKGDLLAEIEIVLPENLTEEQRESIIAVLDRVPTSNPRRELQW